MNQVRSKDGTVIVFEQIGSGPVVIVVAAALSDRSDTKKLSQHLAQHFTVINYDRRGRGQSSDTQPYAVDREIEDIEALLDAVGGTGFLFGSSSGSVLALEAATKLGPKITKLFMYEPPFIIDDSQPPMPDDLANQIKALVASGQHHQAVKLFFLSMGIPKMAVNLMRFLMPGWSKMAKMAHTIAYDLTILAGMQAGKPLPATRWDTMTTPTLVMVGSKSEPFFHNGAQELSTILPSAQYRILEGKGHGAVMMAPQAVANGMQEFFMA